MSDGPDIDEIERRWNEYSRLSADAIAGWSEDAIPVLIAEVRRLRGRKMFPIQRYGKIPWEVAQRAYETYAARFGDSQSLERLAQRGGFGVNEMDMFYPEWREHTSVIAGLEAQVAAMRGVVKAAVNYRVRQGTTETEALQEALAKLDELEKADEHDG